MNSITSFLNRSGIKTWQFDYNKGFIFTWGEKYSVSRFNLENAKPITRFDFNSLDEISQWGNSHPKYQSFELEEQPMLGLPGEGKAMRVVLNTSNYGWKTITSPAFDVSTDRVYVIKLGMRFINAQDVQLGITEFDKNGVIINSAIVQPPENGYSYWKDIKFSYRPFNKEVTSIRLSISHGDLTRQPLPNMLWIDAVRIYDVSDQVQENSISVPFKENNNNNYKVFVRYLESPEGGRFNAMLEGSLIQISTLSSDSKFVWKDLGEYNINQGNHNMTFTNERGFNAINTILLIPKDQIEEIKGRIEDWLNQNSSTLMYIFEAESDMNINDKTIADGIQSDSGNLILENSTAWTQFNVRQEGDYRLWIKGSGNFAVAVNDQSEVLNASSNKPLLSKPFRLDQGESRLEVTPLQESGKSSNAYQSTHLADDSSNNGSSEVTNVIDSIWLVRDSSYPRESVDNNNNSQNRMHLTTTIAEKGWPSQKYEIKLDNATTPFTISLAEPFNQDLRAAIYTKDGLSKTESLLPLFYSLKSGVYIDSPATVTKIVIYNAGPPLEWLVAISGFISLAAYILLVLSSNMKLTNRFKGLGYNLNHLIKDRISQNRSK
jgi:hypothetical protein